MTRKNIKGIFHNPGYDFWRAVHYMAAEADEIPQKLVLPYFRPTIALMCACASVEGYVHTYAQRIDAQWKPQSRSFESIKNRITRAYALIGKTVDFSEQPFKDVMDLFSFRKRLLHPILQWEERPQNKPIRTVFEEVEAQFSLKKLRNLTDAFRKRITKDFGLRDTWWMRSTNVSILDLPDERD